MEVELVLLPLDPLELLDLPLTMTPAIRGLCGLRLPSFAGENEDKQTRHNV